MRKKLKDWRKKIRKNANPGRAYCRIYDPGKVDKHSPGRLVAVGEWRGGYRDD